MGVGSDVHSKHQAPITQLDLRVAKAELREAEHVSSGPDRVELEYKDGGGSGLGGRRGGAPRGMDGTNVVAVMGTVGDVARIVKR